MDAAPPGNASSAAPPAGPPALFMPAPAPITFHGRAREYFRIWIVNTFLTIATLGVFAAWAKVRRRRYLRGNTEFLGHRFDYTARPSRILVGNIIVVTLFMAYAVVGQVYLGVQLAALLLAVVMAPWVIVRSLSFNAHNTVYRGMRFYFRPNYAGAAVTFLARALLLPVTLGFYYPAWMRAQRKFVVENHRLGDGFFSFHGTSGRFYTVYFLAGLIVFAFAIGGGTAGAVIDSLLGDEKHETTFGATVFIAAGAYVIGIYVARLFTQAQLFNYVWNNTRLDAHTFYASMGAWAWMKLQFANLCAIVFSCGLLYPWALMRSTRYMLGCVEFFPAGPIENISKFATNRGSAVGEAAGELFGFDFGL